MAARSRGVSIAKKYPNFPCNTINTGLETLERNSHSIDMILLGTSSSNATHTRGLPSTIIRTLEDTWVVDCGEGTKDRVMRSPFNTGQINNIFITHMHGDHVFGVFGLIFSVYLTGNFDKSGIRLYGPPGLREFIDFGMTKTHSKYKYKAKMTIHELVDFGMRRSRDDIEMDPEQNCWHLNENELYDVKAGKIKHTVPCFGMVIKEKNKPGKMNEELLEKFQVPHGIERRLLKQGNPLTLKNGQIIQPEQVLGPTIPGRKIAILGDTSDARQMMHLVQNADLLIHEATLMNHHKLAIKRGHSTAKIAGEFAKESNVRRLVLNHISPQYNIDVDHSNRKKMICEASDAYGSSHVLIGSDMMRLCFPIRSGTLENDKWDDHIYVSDGTHKFVW